MEANFWRLQSVSSNGFAAVLFGAYIYFIYIHIYVHIVYPYLDLLDARGWPTFRPNNLGYPEGTMCTPLPSHF